MFDIKRLFAAIFLVVSANMALSQADTDTGELRMGTVERPPFATMVDGAPTGFSLELMREIGIMLDRPVSFTFYDSFPEMLAATQAGENDGAVANISITSARERIFDFSQPIFGSGIGVLVTNMQDGNPVFAILKRWDVWGYGAAALAVLFACGMLMWFFERRAQPYFDRSAGQAVFPSFWWALNIVVNGGFEERAPQSFMGRIFATFLVISSLFIVSIFVATITSAVTVAALQDEIDTINDLEGQRVATVAGSTSADFLEARDIGFTGYDTPAEMFAQLEAGQLDAVVFDAPILAYYAAQPDSVSSQLLPRIYKRENYGIVLPEGSPLREDINRALLGLREEGIYDALLSDWFGTGVN